MKAVSSRASLHDCELHIEGSYCRPVFPWRAGRAGGAGGGEIKIVVWSRECEGDGVKQMSSSYRHSVEPAALNVLRAWGWAWKTSAMEHFPVFLDPGTPRGINPETGVPRPDTRVKEYGFL